MIPKKDTKIMHQQKLQNMHQSSLFYQFLKKFVQLSMSFSVFAILFLHTSWPPFFHSLISHLSTFSSHLFSLATDKNYIFLLCNGLLVFIAKYSSHTVDTCPPPLPETSPENDLYYKEYSQSMQSSIEKSHLMNNVATNEDEIENGLERNEVIPEEDVDEKHVVYQITYRTIWEEAEEEKHEDVIIDEDNKEYYTKEYSDSWSYDEQEEVTYEYYDEDEAEQEEGNYECYDEDEDEDEDEAEQKEGNYEYFDKDEAEQEEEAIAKMSTEELNRKFDDFIRKMKEDLRIEAQQQLIVV